MAGAAELTGRRVPGGLGATARALAARPRLWPAAARQARSLVVPGWWRRPPFLPLPDRDWVSFRLTTAYGSADAPLRPDDVLVWLAWSDTVRSRPRTGLG